MNENPGSDEARSAAPGWYPYAGGQRFWDGEGWTSNYAPPRSFSYAGIAGAVAVGIMGAWLLIWLFAQLEPSVFFWPIKTVAQEDTPQVAVAPEVGGPEIALLLALAAGLILLFGAAWMLLRRRRAGS
jgi:hypothetical protein